MSEASLLNLELALAEAVHRARNDLQAVAAMLQLRAAAAINPECRQAMREAAGWVHALASLNARLDALAPETTTTIGSQQLFSELGAVLRATHFAQRAVAFEVEAEEHRVPFNQGKPLGLILNELVLNALKYAFPDDRAGSVVVVFRKGEGDYHLTVQDDGVGMDLEAPPQGSGLGRRLVRALTSQIGGGVETRSGPDGAGTAVTICWPVS